MTAIEPAALLDAGAPALANEGALMAAAGDLVGLATLFASVRRVRATLAFVEAELETAVAGLYWKVSELRARHVDPARFCEEEAGRTTVGIRPHV